MNVPKIHNLHISYLGTHETIVILINNSIHSVNTWNYTKDDQGNYTFFTDNPCLQLHFNSNAVVPVIRG